MSMTEQMYREMEQHALTLSPKDQLFRIQIETLAHDLRNPDRATSTGSPLGDGPSTQVYEWDEPGPFGQASYTLKVTVETKPVEKGGNDCV